MSLSTLSTSIPSTLPTRLHVLYPQKAFNRKDLLPLGSDYLWEIEQGIVRSLTWNEEGQFGQTVPQGKLLNFHLTHQDISETIGLTRVTVTRLINRLEQEGRIVRSHRNFILTTG